MARLIASTELKERMTSQDVLIVDVSSPGTFLEGHVPGAINIPIDDLNNTVRNDRMNFLKKDYIVVYGEGHETDLSDRASEILEGLGFDRVGNFDGGRSAWYNAGYKLERDKPNSAN